MENTPWKLMETLRLPHSSEMMGLVMFGKAVLFAGIMKSYRYSSGDRGIREPEMDSKRQLTSQRWGGGA